MAIYFCSSKIPQRAYVDFERGTVTVREENAKSGKARHVPVNDAVRSTLKSWREQTSSAGLVLRVPMTGKQFDNANKAWREVLKEAKITAFRWHDMRHDFASKLTKGGVDLYVVKELLGHPALSHIR
jgi:integrase